MARLVGRRVESGIDDLAGFEILRGSGLLAAASREQHEIETASPESQSKRDAYRLGADDADISGERRAGFVVFHRTDHGRSSCLSASATSILRPLR